MRDIEVTARLETGIRVKAEMGSIKEIPVGPDTYTGEYTVTPSTEPITLPTKDKLMADDLMIEGTEIDWDFILYPIGGEDGKLFNARQADCVKGSTIIIEFIGCGRVFAVYSKGDTIDGVYFPPIVYKSATDYLNHEAELNKDVIRITLNDIPYTSTDKARLVFAGYQWSGDGTHSNGGSYQFRGEYMKVKLIPPTDSEYELEES